MDRIPLRPAAKPERKMTPRRKKVAIDQYLEADPWAYISRLFGNGIGKMNVAFNTLGVVVCLIYFYFIDNFISIGRMPHIWLVAPLTYASVLILAVSCSKIWVREIRQFVRLKLDQREIPPGLLPIVRRKIINFPLFAALNSLAAWGLAAVVTSLYRFSITMPGHTFSDTLIRSAIVFIGTIIAGTITAALTFFIVEIICQHIWPYFFPDGEPTRTPGIFRPTIQIRILLYFILGSLVPLLLMAVLSYNKAKLMLVQDPRDVIGSLFVLMAFILLSTIFMGYILSRLLVHTIVDPVQDLEAAMDRVARGELDARVTVASIDELGDLTVQFNRMAEGLKDRERMRQSLELAMEVQQQLLPGGTPEIQGLDLAGTSRYCDETGGDYYDFMPGNEQDQPCVLVGDVSEHGIPSALLMATARAFLRQRLSMPGRLDAAIGDVNQQFCRDVGDTGRFMTLLCCRLDMGARTATWVNAGHAPALIYQPRSRTFHQPDVGGPALGTLEDYQYSETVTTLAPAQIILMGTDGIWETRNTAGEEFGLERVKDCISAHADRDAREIMDRLFLSLDEFRSAEPRLDDVTVVLIKVNDAGQGR